MDDKLLGTSPLVIKPQLSPLQELGLSLDSDGHLNEDVMCRNCDYNLRGLKLDTKCPECETAIEQTINRSILRFSDQAWLKRVRSGLSLMLLYIFVVIVMNIFLMVATFVFDIGFSEDSVGLELCIAIFLIIYIVLETISFLRITTLESSEQSANGRITARKLARIALIASIITSVIAMMSDTNRYTAFFPDVIEIPLLASISYWTSHASSLLSIVGMFALFDYAHSFAKRFPEDRLAKTTRRVMWGYMIPIIAFSIWFIAMEIADKYDLIDHSSMTISNVYMVVQIVIGVPILVFGIYGIVLIFKYRNQFTKAMKLGANAAS